MVGDGRRRWPASAGRLHEVQNDRDSQKRGGIVTRILHNLLTLLLAALDPE